jgi:hypothetical protein
MKFSADGRYLALGSSSGCVSVWAFGEHLHHNVSQVLEAMKATDNFWHNFPIYLPNYEQQKPREEIIIPEGNYEAPF